MTGKHEAAPGGLLAAAAHEARVALTNGWVEAQHDEQTARARLAGYNDRENERAARMRHYIRSCQTCASPIYEDPGYCVQCAWEGDDAA